jgi:hypothetical protein
MGGEVQLTLVGALVIGLGAVTQALIVVGRMFLKGTVAPKYYVDALKADIAASQAREAAAVARGDAALALAKTQAENARLAWGQITRLIALLPPGVREAEMRALREAEGT